AAGECVARKEIELADDVAVGRMVGPELAARCAVLVTPEADRDVVLRIPSRDDQAIPVRGNRIDRRVHEAGRLTGSGVEGNRKPFSRERRENDQVEHEKEDRQKDTNGHRPRKSIGTLGEGAHGSPGGPVRIDGRRTDFPPDSEASRRSTIRWCASEPIRAIATESCRAESWASRPPSPGRRPC